ncbi:unnamed protein product [Bemisia tabaci]|uniref:Uncharacterized protein n=1 Tax=Bemisia tabaci TaxID=7038 RepID=A0A9P0AJI3_BEMTA|nr:unnamed protein product [Bemisia tabaci]
MSSLSIASSINFNNRPAGLRKALLLISVVSVWVPADICMGCELSEPFLSMGSLRLLYHRFVYQFQQPAPLCRDKKERQICKGCELELQTCTNAYEATMLEKNVGGPESSQAYCEVLRSYIQCTRKLSKACYTDITWRSYKPIQDRLHKTHCSGKNNGTHPRPKGPGRTTTPEPPATRPPIPCTYHGKSRFHYCGLFGDPHLRTFHDEYQTCQIGGAWPLIDNPYFAVQVTNERLQPRVPATAPTKSGSEPSTSRLRGEHATVWPCGTDKDGEPLSPMFTLCR